MGNSVVVFVQSLGTAITLAISDVIFEGSLESELPKQAPLADAAAIIAAGATHFRMINLFTVLSQYQFNPVT